jgi:hypothetical protein
MHDRAVSSKKNYLGRLSLGLLLLPIVAGGLTIGAEARDRRAAAVQMVGPADTADETSAAKGCYWYRQKQYCGRYCYIEGNGIRYCRDREPEAFPQMPEASVFVGEPYTVPSVK